MELRKAVFDDWPLLLTWKNDYSTRLNCKDEDMVEEDSHKKWVNKNYLLHHLYLLYNHTFYSYPAFYIPDDLI